MKTNFLRLSFLFLSLFVLFGCANQTDVYTLKSYESPQPVEIKLEDQDNIKEIDALIDKIKESNDPQDIKTFDKPKGFSYEIIINDKVTYEFLSGYLIDDTNVYEIPNYDEIITTIKETFQ